MKKLLPVLMGVTLLLMSSTEGWSLPPCPGSYDKTTWTNCVGIFTLSSGNKYVGEFRDGIGHGQGTYTHANGDKYVGEFKDGKRNEQGTLTYADGTNYVGEWKDDNWHGQGTLTYADGTNYVGEWKDDNWHGQGTLTYADGTNYVGEWKDDNWHGQGTLTYADGGKYVGEYMNDKRHGQGIQYHADGTVDQAGVWEHGKLEYARKISPTGTAKKAPLNFSNLPPCPENQNQHYDNCFGTYTYANGAKYTGEFRNNYRQGQGVYTYPTGRVQQGIWEYGKFEYARKILPTISTEIAPLSVSNLPPCPEDQSQPYRNCFGTYTWANGAEYVGEWKDNKRHGRGSNTSANGDKYVGEYRDGKRHGQGTGITFSNGERYVGKWKDNKAHGQGIKTSADGTVEEGIFLNDEFKYANKLSPTVTAEKTPLSASSLSPCPENQNQHYDNCFGTDTYDDGEKYVGEWKDEKKHGQGTYTFADGDKYVGEWKNGKYRGQGTYTYANGDKYVGEFKNDKRHGQGVLYRTDGTVDQEGIFLNDEFKYKKPSPLVAAEKEGLSDKQLCNFAIRFNDPKWDEPAYLSHVSMAKRRGFTEEKCAWLTGRFASVGPDFHPDMYGAAEDEIMHPDEVGLWGVEDPEGLAPLVETTELKLRIVPPLVDKGGAKLKPCRTKDVTLKLLNLRILPNWYNCFGPRKWEDGSRYVGEWGDGKFNGVGIKWHVDGKIYKGEWRQNLKHGWGTLIHADARIERGKWFNDVKQDDPSIDTEKIAAIEDRIRSYGQLFDQVRNHVRLNSDQTPLYRDIRMAGHEAGGDILFIPRE